MKRFIIIVLASVFVVSLVDCYLFAVEQEQQAPTNSLPLTIKTATGDLDNVELERVGAIIGGDQTRRRGQEQQELPAGDYQPSACQLVPVVHLLHHLGCQPKAIASFACSGSCSSYVKTSTSNFWQHERSCSCCQQTGSQEATFALDCPSLDPPYRKVKTHAPVECLCRACTDLGRENLRPQELVEALAGESSRGFNFKSSS